VNPNIAPSKAPVTALLRWLLLYPVAAAGCCFALGAATKIGAQVAAGVLALAAGVVVGWEASREGCDDSRCAGWTALAATLTLLLCIVGFAAAYETIYCDDRNCRPLFD
jgi:uncharacterized membrane protein YphA (DoxX/SURF4 family)